MHFVKRCPACGHWAVFSRSVFCGRAAEACTHCGQSTPNLPWDQAAREAHARHVERVEALCARCPELRGLQRPGDHVQLEVE